MSCTSSLHCCLSLDRQPWTRWPVLDIISQSSHQSASSSLPVNSNLPVFQCTGFGLWPHDQNPEAYVSVQLPTGHTNSQLFESVKDKTVTTCVREGTCWHQLCFFFVFVLFCFGLSRNDYYWIYRQPFPRSLGLPLASRNRCASYSVEAVR